MEVEKVELPAEQEGYAYLVVAETSPLTLTILKEAIAKTPFQLDNVEWTVEREKRQETPR